MKDLVAGVAAISSGSHRVCDARTMSMLAASVVALALFACGDNKLPSLQFKPALELEYTIARGPDLDLNVGLDSTERTSVHVRSTETFRGQRYTVPGYRCLRASDTEWTALPAGAKTPGEAATFEVLQPLDGTDYGILVFLPHGNGLEFIEAFALELYNRYPEFADEFGVDPDHGTRDVEQSTRDGAKRNVASTSTSLSAIALARLGATVVLPGNCWGDGGHGVGRDGDGYYDGPREGGSFDHAVWTWARAELAHRPEREVAFGCSGGGHRIAEELIRDPEAFRAAIIDSPADNVREFLTEPRAEILDQTYTILRAQAWDAVMDQFFEGIWDSKDAAAQFSLGAVLPEGQIATPIYFTYSTQDPLTTYAVTRGMADAMAGRPAPNKVVVHDEKVHCQINSIARMSAATGWLATVLAAP
jgi:hypothetical protein